MFNISMNLISGSRRHFRHIRHRWRKMSIVERTARRVSGMHSPDCPKGCGLKTVWVSCLGRETREEAVLETGPFVYMRRRYLVLASRRPATLVVRSCCIHLHPNQVGVAGPAFSGQKIKYGCGVASELHSEQLNCRTTTARSPLHHVTVHGSFHMLAPDS